MTPYTRIAAFAAVLSPVLVIGFSLLLAGCAPVGANGEPLPDGNFKAVATLGSMGPTIYEVEIDGEKYLVTRVYGGWSLCPKVKSRDILPRRSDEDGE
jgi:hypothetical protein